MNAPQLHLTRVGELDHAAWEWNAALRGSAPTMVFAHATGFHGRVWDAVIENFPDAHILSLELYGHGRSGGGEVEHWLDIAAAATGVLKEFGIKHAIGTGHSMGAHVLLQVAHDNPGMFERLTLFDPVIVEPEWYSGDAPFSSGDGPHPIARRKRDFASAEAMFGRFEDRDPYALFQPRVLRDYCEYGLLPAKDGGFELACAPEVEASVYSSSRSNPGILDAARGIEIPVQIVRAKRTNFTDFTSSPTWAELAAQIPQGRDICRPDMTHFHPFQDPADAATIIGSN